MLSSFHSNSRTKGEVQDQGQLERLEKIQSTIYVIPVLEETDSSCKRRQVGINSFVQGEVVPVSVDIEAGDVNSIEEEVQGLDGIGSLMHSDPTAAPQELGSALNSTLITTEAMERYLQWEAKLRKDLLVVSMEDHAWHLKSWDHNGVGILKLCYGECNVDFRSLSGDHTKATIHNLFNNFKKSHIMSDCHIRSWCKNKGVRYEDHPM